MEFPDDFLGNVLLALFLLALALAAGFVLMLAAGALFASLGFKLNRFRHPPAVAPIRQSLEPASPGGPPPPPSRPPMGLPSLLVVMLLGALGGGLVGVFLALVLEVMGILAAPLAQVIWNLAQFGAGVGASVALLVILARGILGVLKAVMK